MKKKENGYELIQQQLKERVESCRKYIANISKERILSLSLADVQALKDFCDNEYETMTKILMVDIYHIIGMVDLTTRQVQEFYRLVKEYSNYRPNIEKVRASLKDIYDLPNVPVHTKFSLLGLKGITLYSGPVDGVEEEEFCTIDNYTQCKSGVAKAKSTSTPTIIPLNEDKGIQYPQITERDKNTIVWTFNKDEDSILMASRIFLKVQNANLDFFLADDKWVESFKKKIESGEKAFGVTFNRIDNTYYITLHKELNKKIIEYLDLYKDVVSRKLMLQET